MKDFFCVCGFSMYVGFLSDNAVGFSGHVAPFVLLDATTGGNQNWPDFWFTEQVHRYACLLPDHFSLTTKFLGQIFNSNVFQGVRNMHFFCPILCY